MGIDTEHELLSIYADQGFTLDEPDDHILVLKHQEEIIGRFFQWGATKESIQEECGSHMASHTLVEKNNCR